MRDLRCLTAAFPRSGAGSPQGQLGSKVHHQARGALHTHPADPWPLGQQPCCPPREGTQSCRTSRAQPHSYNQQGSVQGLRSCLPPHPSPPWPTELVQGGGLVGGLELRPPPTPTLRPLLEVAGLLSLGTGQLISRRGPAMGGPEPLAECRAGQEPREAWAPPWRLSGGGSLRRKGVPSPWRRQGWLASPRAFLRPRCGRWGHLGPTEHPKRKKG